MTKKRVLKHKTYLTKIINVLIINYFAEVLLNDLKLYKTNIFIVLYVNNNIESQTDSF